MVQEVLGEIRRSLIVIFVVLVAASVLAYARIDTVIEWLRANGLPGFVFLAPTEAFTVRVKISLFLGLVAALPLMLWEISRLAGKALRGRLPSRAKWSRWLIPLVIASYALFLSGIIFGYRCVLPYALRFFLSFASDTLRPMITFSSYVSFVAGTTLPFGLVFELPLVLGVLTGTGVITYQAMRRNRGYIIVGAFCLAAVLTPADVFSQIALAIPLIVLFEVAAIVARLAELKRNAFNPGRPRTRRRPCPPPS